MSPCQMSSSVDNEAEEKSEMVRPRDPVCRMSFGFRGVKTACCPLKMEYTRRPDANCYSGSNMEDTSATSNVKKTELCHQVSNSQSNLTSQNVSSASNQSQSRLQLLRPKSGLEFSGSASRSIKLNNPWPELHKYWERMLLLVALTSVLHVDGSEVGVAGGEPGVGLLSGNGISYPAEIRIKERSTERQHMDATTYLMKYGYLPGSDLETGALRTLEELTRAVKEFQRNADLPLTGLLDEVTVKAMSRSRCGVADVISPGQGHRGGYSHRHSQDAHHSRAHHRYHHKSHNHHEAVSGRSRRDTGPDFAGEVKNIVPKITLSRDTRSVGPQDYVLGPSVWHKKWLTFRILNYTPDLGYHETRDAIIRAFHLWSDVTQLTFHEIQSGDADIYIQFASGYHHDGYTFDGQGMVLAHAFFPGEGRGGDIHFDEDEKWTVRTKEGVNLYSVMAHELGHSLGLAHSYVPGSLMYPWHRGYDPNFTLHHDDITAIQSFYGAKEKKPPTDVTSPPKPRPPQPPTPPPITTSVTTRQTTTATTSTSKASTTGKRFIVNVNPVTKATVTKAPVVKGTEDTPDRCSVTFDAISLIRGDVFAFSGKWFWRLTDDGVMAGYPVLISRFWFGLPKNLEKIDAVFERPGTGHIIFFSGMHYFEFYGNSLLPQYSPSGRPITDFGLPADLGGVDAAFVWAHNRRVYVIKDTMYWKLDDGGKRVEYGYPRDMSMWSGVPLPVYAAFTHSNRQTYFFHGDQYYEFNNIRMRVQRGYPQPITARWLGCEATPTDSADMSRHDAQRGFNMAAQHRASTISMFSFTVIASFLRIVA